MSITAIFETLFIEQIDTVNRFRWFDCCTQLHRKPCLRGDPKVVLLRNIRFPILPLDIDDAIIQSLTVTLKKPTAKIKQTDAKICCSIGTDAISGNIVIKYRQ